MTTTYKVISTVRQKREGTNYSPVAYSSFKEALAELEGTIDELERLGGFLCIPVSKVCYAISALYPGYSKSMGSIYVKKFTE